MAALEAHLLLLEEIQDALECVICMDVPKHNPVYQCNNGHIVCKSCHSNVVHCGVCKVKLGNLRNLAVEKVLEKCPRPCEYDYFGCSMKLTRDALEFHENICKYKPVQCLSTDCEKLVPLIRITKHMEEIHHVYKASGYTIKYENLGKEIENEVQIHPAHFMFDGISFFSFVWRSFGTCHRHWYVWLYMVGNPDETKSYIYTVTMKSDEFCEEIMYKGQPVSLQIKREDVFKMGRCLSFDDVLAKRFCVNDCLTISFTINRKQTFKSLVKSKSLVFSPSVPNFDKYVNPPFSQEY